MQPEIPPTGDRSSSSIDIPRIGLIKLKRVVLASVFLLAACFFVYDVLVVTQVNSALQYLEDYYDGHGYYPNDEEFKKENLRFFFPDLSNGYLLGDYNFNQTYSLTYRLNTKAIMNWWEYAGEWVSSCDTRNICWDSNDLQENPNGIRWHITVLGLDGPNFTINTGQGISWSGSRINDIVANYRWQLKEEQYVGPVEVNFSYDNDFLTKMEPIKPIRGSWYREGYYFRAIKAGETPFKITITRPFYDTGYENGTFGGSILTETIYTKEMKIKIIDEPLPTFYNYSGTLE